MSEEPSVKTPELSVVVIVFNMQREAPRTLYSLSADYQRGVTEDDYEVIVVENGSTKPLSSETIGSLGSNFRYTLIEDASPSPAAAVNQGMALARAPFVGIMIDGARIATPGIIALALQALQGFKRAVVGTVGFHLGPDIQTRSPRHGYNADAEDGLLESIDWRNQGYRLFEIGALAGSSPTGWLGIIAESNLLFLPKTLFNELRGFDEKFDLPGGGLVNLDFYKRACESEQTTLITLLGEATFHQIHGGTMTNKPAEEIPRQMAVYQSQYQRLRGEVFRPSTRTPLLFGPIKSEIVPWLHKVCDLSLKFKPRPNRPTRQSSKKIDSPVGWVPRNVAESEEQQPGGRHYRSFVGQFEDYDTLSALQFSLVTLLGLRENHCLLDIGCGSLRAGRLFIPYLRPGHYFGIEPNRRLLQEGIEQELGIPMLDARKPRFAHNDDFDLAVFDTGFDFILAQSIFSHTGVSQLRCCLESVRNVLKPDGLMIATFLELREDQARDEWIYPGFNFFSWQTLARIAAQNGLHCRKIDWPHILQTWFAVSTNLHGMEQRITAAGVDLIPDDILLTGFRFQERRAGHKPGFYRHWRARQKDSP